jgi:hypothetical protein
MNVFNGSVPDAVDDTPIFEFTGPNTGRPTPPQTAEEILLWMLRRRKRNRPLLPDGYVPPEGIDICTSANGPPVIGTESGS